MQLIRLRTILRSDAELAEIPWPAQARPYFDPALRDGSETMRELALTLYAAGLVTFRPSVRGVVRVFTVLEMEFAK